MSCYIWATSIMPVPRVKLITTSWTSANSCLGTTFPSTPSAAITTCIPAELATTGSSIKLGKNRATSALQNPNWQFVALDTGHNDNDSGTVATNMTDLVSAGDWSSAEWALKKIQAAGARKTVLLSHHQLFSPLDSSAMLAINLMPTIQTSSKTFQPVLNCIEWWFWGHEHTLGIYAPYMGLKRGRCVGASAVPVLINQQSYTTATGLQTLNNGPMPVWDANGILGNNGRSMTTALPS